MSELRKKIRLDLDKVPSGKKAAAKKAVGDFLVNQVLRDIERGFSPVEGEGQFDKLTKKYADAEKGGRRTANLQLEGDLKEATRFKNIKDGIEFGNFLVSQEGKADGHNQLSAKARAWARKKDFPKRRYIPSSKQKFRAGIELEIESIVKGFEEIPSEDVQALAGRTTNETEDGNVVKTDFVDLFSDEALEAAIKRQLSGEV